MSKKNPLSPYHLRSNSPSKIFEEYVDPNEERHLLIILSRNVSRWKKRTPQRPWLCKPEQQVLDRLQRLDKNKLLKNKQLSALREDSTHYLNPDYIRWKKDKKGNVTKVEYSTDIKRFYNDEIMAAMQGLAMAKERLGKPRIPQVPTKKKQTFLDVAFTQKIIQEVENEEDASSEEEDGAAEAQRDNIGIPPCGQEERKDESEESEAETETTEPTNNSTTADLLQMMKEMKKQITSLESVVKNQGFQYELAINKAQTEAPRKVNDLMAQVEEASNRIKIQQKQLDTLTKLKAEEFVKKNEELITTTTERLMQASVTRLSNLMDKNHEAHRQLMITEAQDAAVKLAASMKQKFERELHEIKTRAEEEHQNVLIANLDSYSAETTTAKDNEIYDLRDVVMGVETDLRYGDLFKINTPLKRKMDDMQAAIEQARDGHAIHGKIDALEDVLEAKIEELKHQVESKLTDNELSIDYKITKFNEIHGAAEDTRLTSHATMIEELKKKMTKMEEDIQGVEEEEPDETPSPTIPTSTNPETPPRRFHNQPAFIPGSAKRNLCATPLAERATAQMANDMAANMTANVSKFEKATLHHDLHKSTIDVAELEDYYENLQGLCRSHQIPLVPRDQIRNVRSCMPPEISLMSEVTQSIAKQALYNKINSSFTEEPVLLRNMITQNDKQDGYKVIYQIMSTFCQDLMDYPPTWGPPIDPNKDLWAYSKQLKRFRTQQGYKALYSEDDVAFEIIQQAMKISKYKSLAQALMASYITSRVNNLDMATFDKFTIISTLARIDMRELGSVPEEPTINKGHAKDEDTSNSYDNRPRGRYPPPKIAKNRVTCIYCKTFGHNVPEQCCHFGAKMYHAQRYMEQNPALAKANAEQYEKRHDVNIVKQILAHKSVIAGHLPQEEQEEYMEHVVDSLMRDDYSSNDGISQLTSTTENLSISTPSREQC